MLTSVNALLRRCAGVSRRTFLRLVGLTLGGLSLPAALGRHLLADEPRKSGKRTAVIQLFLGGGPSHVDTWDPKPDAPADHRGPYRAVSTRVLGLQLSSLFPLLAAQADKFIVVRSVGHDTDSHLAARHLMFTGHEAPSRTQTTQNEWPAAGAVAAKFRGARKVGMPAYVCVPRVNAFASGAALGPGCDPFELADLGTATLGAKNLRLPICLDKDRLAELKRIGATLSGMRRDQDKQIAPEEMESLRRAAIEVLAGKAVREALDLEKERPQVRERYGRNTLGQSLLAARRLVEGGSTFVAVEDHGWDTHTDLKRQMDRKGPVLDAALATLLEDLSQRGLLSQVHVVVFGEFGRTPRMNDYDGRDHWGKVFSVLLAGGGLRAGQVVGGSDARGAEPKGKAHSPADVLATVYHVLGIDRKQAVPLLAEGTAIKELI